MSSTTQSKPQTEEQEQVATLNIEKVAIDELNYGDYQRDEIREHVGTMSEDRFDLAQFGIPLIGRRRGGKLYVINGRQRIAAAAATGYTHVLAEVVPTVGKRDEAERFIVANRSPRKVSGTRLHVAENMARREHAIWAEKVLAEYELSGLPESSYVVDTDGRHYEPSRLVTSTGMFREIYQDLAKNDEELATHAFTWALNVLTTLYGDRFSARKFARKNLVMGLAHLAVNHPNANAARVIDALRGSEAYETPDILSEEGASDVGHGMAAKRYAANLAVYINRQAVAARGKPVL